MEDNSEVDGDVARPRPATPRAESIDGSEVSDTDALMMAPLEDLEAYLPSTSAREPPASSATEHVVAGNEERAKKVDSRLKRLQELRKEMDLLSAETLTSDLH